VTSGDRVRQETRHWDEEASLTREGRSKEQAEDYRYFPEPDLVPLEPEASYIEQIASTLPALPSDRRARLGAAVQTESTNPGVVIAVTRGLDDLALAAVGAGGDPARVLTHIEHNLAVEGAANVDPTGLAKLTRLEVDGALTATQAKTVLAEMI